MTALDPVRVQRYARQILLAPVGGAGQARLLGATILLHGDAPLAATYLAAAGLGRLLVTGALPRVAAHDPSFELAAAAVGAPADLVLDLGDGAAFHAACGSALWGAAEGDRVVLGIAPREGPRGSPAARAILETLAAGEALLRFLGAESHAFDYAVT